MFDEQDCWIRPELVTSRQEIQNLIAIVRRDPTDAHAEGISADWRSGIAYNAALKLCTIFLYVEGYRSMQNLAHYRTLQAMRQNAALATEAQALGEQLLKQ